MIKCQWRLHSHEWHKYVIPAEVGIHSLRRVFCSYLLQLSPFLRNCLARLSMASLYTRTRPRPCWSILSLLLRWRSSRRSCLVLSVSNTFPRSLTPPCTGREDSEAACSQF